MVVSLTVCINLCVSAWCLYFACRILLKWFTDPIYLTKKDGTSRRMPRGIYSKDFEEFMEWLSR